MFKRLVSRVDRWIHVAPQPKPHYESATEDNDIPQGFTRVLKGSAKGMLIHNTSGRYVEASVVDQFLDLKY